MALVAPVQRTWRVHSCRLLSQTIAPFSELTDAVEKKLSGAVGLAYQEDIRAGNIQHDERQVSLIAELDHLRSSLLSRINKDYSRRGLALPAITDVKPRNPIWRMHQSWHQWMFQLSHRSIRGLYIHGSVGVGKSYLMDLFFRTLDPSSACRRVHFHEFMIDIHQRINAAKKLTPKADVMPTVTLAIAQEARLLCFDEFQVTDIADAMILQRLFDMLWRAGTVVVATSNRAPESLYEGGINRSRFLPFINLLKTHMSVVHLPGVHDYRRMHDATPVINGDGRQRYFWPSHSSETQQAISVYLEEEIDRGNSLQEEMVRVPMGRYVHVKQAAGSVAQFDFESLCGEPLGAADYLSLCHRYHTIVIDNVPQLNENNFNEARRFVTMIDALYETKTRLIMAMEVSLADLFLHFDAQVESNDGDEEIAIQESFVTGEGGSSSSHATTMLYDKETKTTVEWSATGRVGVSLAQLSAVRDVAFSFARAQSRLVEMSRPSWGRV